MIVYALYCVIVFVKIQAIASSRAICGDRCCAHHFRKNDLCIECPNGTYRDWSYDDGEACKSCPEGRYGYRCTEHCYCNISTHTCDPVNGRCCCLNKPDDCVEDARCLRSNKPDENDNHGNTLIYWLILGVPGSIIIAAIIISATLIRIFKTRRVRNVEMSLNEIQNINTDNSRSMYDYIDETMMENIQIPKAEGVTPKMNELRRDDSSSIGSPSEPCAGEICDGYLNPYTSLAEDWHKNTHVYNDGDDHDAGMGQDEYLNPYQPLENKWQKHTHVYEDADNITVNKDEA